MGRTGFNPSLLIFALLALMQVSKSELVSTKPPQTFHPFCISQFALANHACASIRYGPVPHSSSVPTEDSSLSLAPLPSFDMLSHGRHHNHSHKHRNRRHHHHHQHHHHNPETDEAKECCRWLKAVDDFCVCDLLVRLPIFLSRPVHGFMVVIDDECKVEYKCPGRLMTTTL